MRGRSLVLGANFETSSRVQRPRSAAPLPLPPTTSGRTVADKRLEVSLSCPTRRSSPWAA